MARDPLGYVDGMSLYAGYHVMYGGVDPSGMNVPSGWTLPKTIPGNPWKKDGQPFTGDGPQLATPWTTSYGFYFDKDPPSGCCSIVAYVDLSRQQAKSSQKFQRYQRFTANFLKLQQQVNKLNSQITDLNKEAQKQLKLAESYGDTATALAYVSGSFGATATSIAVGGTVGSWVFGPAAPIFAATSWGVGGFFAGAAGITGAISWHYSNAAGAATQAALNAQNKANGIQANINNINLQMQGMGANQKFEYYDLKLTRAIKAGPYKTLTIRTVLYRRPVPCWMIP